MASIVGGAPLEQQGRFPPRAAGRRRRASRSAAVALASASALAGSALMLLSDPGGGGGGGFFGRANDAGRAAVAISGGGTEPDADGLITLRMYSASHSPPLDDGEASALGHRRATISAGEMQDFGGGGDPATPSSSSPLHEGLHFVDLYVGNPAQRRTLAVMTGSDYTAFPCGDCPDCPPSMSQFQPNQSPSFGKIPCGQCLADGTNAQTCSPDGSTCLASEKRPDRSSWAGYEAHDVALLGAPRSAEGTDAALTSGFPLAFSCQSSARGRFASLVRDGVAGFSPAPTSFVAQMHKAGKLRKARFSLCFERSEPAHLQQPGGGTGAAEPAGPSTDAGAVTLGGFDATNLDTPMTYAQSVAADSSPGQDAAGFRVRVTGMYLREGGGPSIRPDHDVGSVRLRRVAFDANEFNSEGGGMAVDSGALHTVLHAVAEESFKEMWNRSTKGGQFSSGKVFLTDEELNALPTILLQFKAFEGVDTSLNPNTIPNMAGDLDPDNQHDALMAIPPSNYMEWNPASGAYRARISFEHTGGAILGSNAMRGHTILYDLEKRRIGFAESQSCEKKVDEQTKPRAGGDLDDDLYAVEEETGIGGVHMVEGTLTDDDVFGMPIDAAAVPPDAAKEKEAAAPPGGGGGAPPVSASPGKTPAGATPAADAPPPGVQMPPPDDPAGSNNLKAQSQDRAEPMDDDDEGRPPKVENTGQCTSVTCRVWVSVGYFFVGCLLALVYKIAKAASLKSEQLKREEEEEEEEMRRLGYDQHDDPQGYAQQKEVWEGSPPGEKQEVWEGAPAPDGHERAYGGEVRKDLYDLEEVDEEYDREMPPNWR